jgi:uncharacterized protein with gpF-like domain
MTPLLSNSQEDEAQAQMVLMDRLEERFASLFAAELIAASQAMADEYERTRGAPQMPMGHEGAMGDIYRNLALQASEVFGGRVVDMGKSRGLVLETKTFEEFFKRLSQQFIALEAIRQRIASVSAHTRTLIVAIIDRGNADGLGAEAIARQIMERTQSISRTRARVIARTETHAAANYASNEAAKSIGLPLKKQWISSEDHRTRDFIDATGEGVAEFDHRTMNGQTVGMDDPFLMPWAKGDPLRIMYPGQVGQPAGAVINCRCTVGYVVDD